MKALIWTLILSLFLTAPLASADEDSGTKTPDGDKDENCSGEATHCREALVEALAECPNPPSACGEATLWLALELLDP